MYQHVQSIGISHARVRRIACAVLRSLGKRGTEVSVNFVGERRMRRLNHTYRGFDKATDVLSFSLREDRSQIKGELGDVFLSPSYIRRQAKQLGLSYGEECTRMLIHGILHLAGHDHQTKREAAEMFDLQERLLRDCWHDVIPTKVGIQSRKQN